MTLNLTGGPNPISLYHNREIQTLDRIPATAIIRGVYFSFGASFTLSLSRVTPGGHEQRGGVGHNAESLPCRIETLRASYRALTPYPPRCGGAPGGVTSVSF